MGDKNVKRHRKLIWSAFSALAFAIIMTSVLGTSFFDELTTQVVGKRNVETTGTEEADRGDDGHREDWIDGGGYCIVEDNGCEACYDADGNLGGKYCPDGSEDQRGEDDRGEDDRDEEDRSEDERDEDYRDEEDRSEDERDEDYRDEDDRNEDDRGEDDRGEDDRGEDDRGEDDRGEDDRGEDKNYEGDGGENSNKADSKEVEKSLKDMGKNLDNFKDKEWDRLYKDFDRIAKRQDKFVERLKDMEEKDDLDFSDVKDKLAESQAILEDIKEEARVQQNAMSATKKDAQAKLDAVDKSNITWDELTQLWSEVRKVEIYWPIREGLEMRMRVEERYDGLLEMEKEIVRMESEIEVDEEVAKKLEEMSKFIDDFDSYRKNAEDFYAEVLTMTDELVRFTGDSRDMDDMFRDMWDQMDSLREEFETSNEDMETFMEGGWETMDEGWNSGHDKMFYGDMENEIAGLKETLKLVVELEELLKDSENERVSEAVKELKKLVDKASEVLTGLQERLEGGEVEPDVFDKAWGVMDGIGQSAEKYMKVLEKNYDDLPKEAQEIMDMLEEEDDKGPKGGEEHKEKFRDVYGGIEEGDLDKLVEKIRDDVIEEVMRMVSQELMTQLAPYLGEEAVSELVNNLGAFGKNGEALLASSTEVYDRVGAIEDGNMTEKLKELAKRTEETLIVVSLKDSFNERWAEVAAAAEAGDKEKMRTLEGEIEDLLDENFEKSTTGEEAYQYRDVLAGKGLWYYSYVLGATKDGDVSGFKDKNGRATGEFRPENNVTQGESLKMVLNSCGVDMASYPPPQPWMPTDHWAVKEGYLQMAVEVGIDQFIDLKDPNKAATREDVAVMFAQACSLDTEEDQTAFSDYTGKFGGHVQATYNAGIFTGQGDTGRFDGAKNINRAAMAKAMEVAKTYASGDSVLDDLQDFEEVLGGDDTNFPTPTPSDEE